MKIIKAGIICVTIIVLVVLLRDCGFNIRFSEPSYGEVKTEEPIEWGVSDVGGMSEPAPTLVFGRDWSFKCIEKRHEPVVFIQSLPAPYWEEFTDGFVAKVDTIDFFCVHTLIPGIEEYTTLSVNLCKNCGVLYGEIKKGVTE